MQNGISRTLSESEALRDRMKKDLEIVESLCNEPRKEINIPENIGLLMRKEEELRRLKITLEKNLRMLLRFPDLLISNSIRLIIERIQTTGT